MNIIELDNVSKSFHRAAGRQLLRNHVSRWFGYKSPEPFFAIKNVSFTVKPGETVALKPGSYHLMFMGLKAPLKQGDTVEGTLVFAKAGTLSVAFKVEAIGAPGPGGQIGRNAPAPAMHDMKH